MNFVVMDTSIEQKTKLIERLLEVHLDLNLKSTAYDVYAYRYCGTFQPVIEVILNVRVYRLEKATHRQTWNPIKERWAWAFNKFIKFFKRFHFFFRNFFYDLDFIIVPQWECTTRVKTDFISSAFEMLHNPNNKRFGTFPFHWNINDSIFVFIKKKFL